ncbi:MAG: VWA domain-containing protein [Kofleriaceae bacterium]
MSNRSSSLRHWLRTYSLTLVAALGGVAGVAYAATRHTAPPTSSAVGAMSARPVAELARDTVQDTVQIALLLDTSSSMDGLINQARSHLWTMVDKLGQMTRVVNGKVRGVRVELALYEYGQSSVPEAAGFIRQVLPLTTDLDRVSEELHRLATNGGEEYAGQAIQTAVSSLQWSADPTALKFIFVAGNESFDQGPITADIAMAAAKGKDIQVQLIHCGQNEPSWGAAAALARTDLLTIDQDRVAQHIPAPQDAEILRIGGELNTTYLAYGADGGAAQARQNAADLSSAKLSRKVAIERAQLKAKKAYRNANWDLIDAVEKDQNFLAKAKDQDLPAELRNKSLEEKGAIIAAKTAERAKLKAQLGKLEAERAAFLAAEQAKQRDAGAPSLETELLKSAKQTATKKGFKL